MSDTATARDAERAQARKDILLLVAAFGAPYLPVRAFQWRPLGTVVGPGFWAMVVAAVALGLQPGSRFRSILGCPRRPAPPAAAAPKDVRLGR
jgi:hypothetical protein